MSGKRRPAASKIEAFRRSTTTTFKIKDAAPSPTYEKVDHPKHYNSNPSGVEAIVEEVNHPSHYNLNPSGVEAIVVIEHMTFNVGSAVKYLWRMGKKPGEGTLKELKKAAWYIAREIERLEKGEKDGDGT